jgi:serine/threonine protein kinase
MIGQTISHYRVVAKLGEGGMGAVYRAEDLILHREVALKFLPQGSAIDRNARARLLKEAQAASRLNHPNIATIYELNLDENSPFISMELVTGEMLRDHLRRSSPARQRDEVPQRLSHAFRAKHSLTHLAALVERSTGWPPGDRAIGGN